MLSQRHSFFLTVSAFFLQPRTYLPRQSMEVSIFTTLQLFLLEPLTLDHGNQRNIVAGKASFTSVSIISKF